MPFHSIGFRSGRPLIEVLVGASGPLLRRLNDDGQKLPGLHSFSGLLDTGASTTCIDYAIVNSLGLKPTTDTRIYTPSTGSTPVVLPLYQVGLIVLSAADDRLIFPNIPVVGTDLSAQGYQLLIGRDVLNRCLLVYDGKQQSFTLAY